MLKLLSLLCCVVFFNHPMTSIVSAQPQINPFAYDMDPNYVPVELYRARNEKLVFNDDGENVPCETRRAAPPPNTQDLAQWNVPPLKWRSVLPIETSKRDAKHENKSPQVVPVTIPYQKSASKPELSPNSRLAITASPVTEPASRVIHASEPWAILARTSNSVSKRQQLQSDIDNLKSPKPDSEEFDTYANGLMKYLSKDTDPGFDPHDQLSHVTFETKPETVDNGEHPVETRCIFDLPSVDESGRRFLSHKINLTQKPNNDHKLLPHQNNLESSKTANGSEIKVFETKHNDSDRNLLPLSRKSGTEQNSKPINSSDVNRLLEPTKGPGITQFSRSGIPLLETSRVCYACSTKHDETCWKPTRSTTVKYCSKGREACVIRHYQGITDGEHLVIRDCSSDCESMSLGGLKYKSCSICRDNLCNDQAFDSNSSSSAFIPIDIMLACLFLVYLKF